MDRIDRIFWFLRSKFVEISGFRFEFKFNKMLIFRQHFDILRSKLVEILVLRSKFVQFWYSKLKIGRKFSFLTLKLVKI